MSKKSYPKFRSPKCNCDCKGNGYFRYEGSIGFIKRTRCKCSSIYTKEYVRTKRELREMIEYAEKNPDDLANLERINGYKLMLDCFFDNNANCNSYSNEESLAY